ncbi:MAG TPA: DUF305 domain-containing protein [Nocardioides sp.]|nr:DUF305 domain-containing protein [Nocardioides sp.]
MTAVRRRVALLLALVAVLAVGAGGFALGRGSAPDRRTTTGPAAVDVGFSQDMAVHHEQAILMSTLAQTRGTVTVRTIANGILAGQSQELGALRGWLRLWDAPAADPHPMAWMSTEHTMPGMSMPMPGMATGGQLTRLAQLQGRRFDVLFLQLMIRHHQGGILMAADARQHAALGVVRDAAASMIVQQVEDIGAMRALLRAEGGRPLPAPH